MRLTNEGVGAVLEQAADQIRQKVLVAADRRVHPARDPAFSAPTALVQCFPHAVQALELEVPPVAGELDDAAERLGIVGRELRIERSAAGEQAPGAGEVDHPSPACA